MSNKDYQHPLVQEKIQDLNKAIKRIKGILVDQKIHRKRDEDKIAGAMTIIQKIRADLDTDC